MSWSKYGRPQMSVFQMVGHNMMLNLRQRSLKILRILCCTTRSGGQESKNVSSRGRWVYWPFESKLGNVAAYSDPQKIICGRYQQSSTGREGYVICLVLSGSVHHLDIALLWKFTNHDDFALTVRYRSFYMLYSDKALIFVQSERAEGPICRHRIRWFSI